MATWTPAPTSGAISFNDLNLLCGKSSGSTVSMSNLYSGGSHHQGSVSDTSSRASFTIPNGDAYYVYTTRQSASQVNGGGTITTENWRARAGIANRSPLGLRHVESSAKIVPPNSPIPTPFNYYDSYPTFITKGSSSTQNYRLHAGAFLVQGPYSPWVNYFTDIKNPVPNASERHRSTYYRTYMTAGLNALPSSGAISMNLFYGMG